MILIALVILMKLIIRKCQKHITNRPVKVRIQFRFLNNLGLLILFLTFSLQIFLMSPVVKSNLIDSLVIFMNNVTNHRRTKPHKNIH